MGLDHQIGGHTLLWNRQLLSDLNQIENMCFFKIRTWDSMFTFPLVHILVELRDTSDYIADAIFLTTDSDGPVVIVCSDLVILLAFA